MLFQLVKGFLLILGSYVLLVGFPDGAILDGQAGIWQSVQIFNVQYSGFSEGSLLLTLSAVSIFGSILIVQNQTAKPGVRSLISDLGLLCKRESPVGKLGKIKSIDGNRFISVGGKLYRYDSEEDSEILLGNVYKVKSMRGEVLII